MNARPIVRHLTKIAAISMLAATSTVRFAHAGFQEDNPLRRMIWGNNRPYEYYDGHRVYPDNGKIRIDYAKCEQLNWEIILPNQFWRRADRATEREHGALMLVHHNPDITISLAGERVGVEAKDTNQSVLIASQERMKVLLGATILGQRPLAGKNIQGIAYFADIDAEGGDVHYAMWVASHNGYNYSLAVYGNKKYANRINSEMFDFVNDIKQVNPNRVAHAGDSKVQVASRHPERGGMPGTNQPRPFSESLLK